MNVERSISLVDAAKELLLKPDELLELGVAGELELLVSVPQQYKFQLGTRASEAVGEPVPLRVPNLLRLEREHCFGLGIHGKASIDYSTVGYLVTPERGWDRLVPFASDDKWYSDAGHRLLATGPQQSNSHSEVTSQTASHLDRHSWKKDSRQMWTIWIARDDKGTALQVQIQDVRVRSSELRKFLAIKAIPQGDVDEYWRSDFLAYMNQAAMKFWGHKSVVKRDKTTHPDTEAIQEFFVQRDMSKSLAKHAAALIRPDFAATGRRPDAIAMQPQQESERRSQSKR